MSTNTDPQRLVAGSSEIGRLLEAANQSYTEPADELRAWQRFEANYAATRDRTVRRLAFALVPLAAAAYAIYAKKHAEPQPWAAADPAAVTVTKSTADQAIAEESSSVRPAVSGVHLPSLSLPSASSRSLDCQLALKQGPARDKATCLERIAVGDTLEAQRAVLELAILREQQLQDPAGAANALRDYRKRFPDGALRGEVDFALVELLPKTGQARAALRESEALLNTAWGRSRTSELRLMRGRVAQDQIGDLEQAIQELSFVKSEFGAVGDEATLRTAQCYERAGKRDQAKASYREYLARKGVTQAEFARERLRKLESSE
jgi:hypothetical protein